MKQNIVETHGCGQDIVSAIAAAMFIPRAQCYQHCCKSVLGGYTCVPSICRKCIQQKPLPTPIRLVICCRFSRQESTRNLRQRCPKQIVEIGPRLQHLNGLRHNVRLIRIHTSEKRLLTRRLSAEDSQEFLCGHYGLGPRALLCHFVWIVCTKDT